MNDDYKLGVCYVCENEIKEPVCVVCNKCISKIEQDENEKTL